MNKKEFQELPEQMKPYERCELYGVRALTDVELVSVILRTGTQGTNVTEVAKSLLLFNENYPGILGLMRLSEEDLNSIKGIGRIKALQIICIIELSRRIAKSIAAEHLCFTSPESIARYYMEDYRHKDYEEVLILFLNTKSMLIKEFVLSKGTINSSVASPREIFCEALKYNAVYIIMLHNHPSGDPTPSNDDIVNTKRIRDAGELIGIKLLDHIIIGDNVFVSLKEMNMF